MMMALKIGAGVLLAVIVAAAAWFFTLCPCERTPGSYLWGEEITTPVTDWSMANEARLCQIEVNGIIPWSVNLNCMAAPDGNLYLSCARCDGKRWSTLALADPTGRIRIGDKVYPVSLTRVTDPETLDLAWNARADKLSRERQPRPDHWWSFRLASIQ